MFFIKRTFERYVNYTNILFLKRGLFLKPTKPNGEFITLIPTDLNKIKIETKVNIEKCPFFGDIYQESRIV